MTVIAFEPPPRPVAPRLAGPVRGAITDPCVNCTVRPLSICAGLDHDAWERLKRVNQTMVLEPRRLLFQEGDPADHVYTITSGQISLSMSLPDGRRQITEFLGPGDFIGLGLDSEMTHHTLTAEALTEVHVCRFPRAPFTRAMEQSAQLGRKVLSFASRRIAAAGEQQLMLGRKTAVERVASFLLRAARRNEERGAPASPLTLAMTRNEIADHLGLTLETVSRGFSRLRQLGVIRLDGADRVTLNDLGRLRELAGGD
jgi:CRP/FNR family transcriptional regulator